MASIERRKAYERLRQLLADATAADVNWTRNGKFTTWRESVLSAIQRLGDNASRQYTEFRDVDYEVRGWIGDGDINVAVRNCFLRGMQQATAIIKAVIADFEHYELGSPDELLNKNAVPAAESDSKMLLIEDAPAPISKKVFLVHGHDNEMKETVARFLSRLGCEPVILHELPSGGSTIIEKIEKQSGVRFAVVLLSPDDVGANKGQSENLLPRARQNVVLELGYFIAKLSRKNVCPIVRGNVERPSDVDGIVYVAFEGDWRLPLIRELKNAGIEVDANAAV